MRVHGWGLVRSGLYRVGRAGMERGSVSMDRDHEGNDVPSDMELVRLAVPRRVLTMSHFQYVADRLKWLYEHCSLIGGLEFEEEPPVLRFFRRPPPPERKLGGRPRRSLRGRLRPRLLTGQT